MTARPAAAMVFRMKTTNTDATPAISVEGLTKRYGTVTAVDELSFTVRALLPRSPSGWS
jgi:hypothetical protein